MTATPRLVTHSGKFHCDEVFAHAVLRLALGLRSPGDDYILVRTRTPALIAGGDIVWDVGTVFDAAANRFDTTSAGRRCGPTARRSRPPGWFGRCMGSGP